MRMRRRITHTVRLVNPIHPATDLSTLVSEVRKIITSFLARR